MRVSLEARVTSFRRSSGGGIRLETAAEDEELRRRRRKWYFEAGSLPVRTARNDRAA